MTDEVLNLRFCPDLLGREGRVVFYGFALSCNSPVENDRERRELNLFGKADLRSKTGL